MIVKWTYLNKFTTQTLFYWLGRILVTYDRIVEKVKDMENLFYYHFNISLLWEAAGTQHLLVSIKIHLETEPSHLKWRKNLFLLLRLCNGFESKQCFSLLK